MRRLIRHLVIVLSSVLLVVGWTQTATAAPLIVENNQGQSSWQPIGPHLGYGPMAFESSRNSQKVMVLQRNSPAIFVSTDRAQTWRQLFTLGVAGGDPRDVATHPGERDTAYLVVNGGQLDPSYRGKILKTTDWGETWTALPAPDVFYSAIEVSADGVLAVAEEAGPIRISADDGETWHIVSRSTQRVRDMAWIGGYLYLASNAGLEVVRPDEDGWQPATVIFRPGTLGWAHTVTGGSDGSIFVSPTIQGEIYRSQDGGATFELVHHGGFSSYQELEGVGDLILGASTSGLWVSSDGGDTFVNWGTPVDGTVLQYLGSWDMPHPQERGKVFVGGSGAGTYAATGPGEFTRAGVPGAIVNDLVVTSPGEQDRLVAGTFRSTFWTDIPRRASIHAEDLEWSGGMEARQQVDVPLLATDPEGQIVYRITHLGWQFRVEVSRDGGIEWEQLTTRQETPVALMVHPADPQQVIVSVDYWEGPALLVTRDGGKEWTSLPQEMVWSDLAGDPENAERIWAVNQTGTYVSDDAGRSFTQVDSTPAEVVAVSPADPDHVVVAGTEIRVSRDGGRTFATGYAEPGLLATDIAFDPVNPERVAVSGRSHFDMRGTLHEGAGVVLSRDGGASFVAFDRGLDNLNVLSLAFAPDGRTLYAGTYGGSVHRIGLPAA